MEPQQRAEIFQLQDSPDSRDRTLALTKAAAVPAMPDPRLTTLSLAAEQLRLSFRMFPNDPLAPRIEELAGSTKAVIAAIREQTRG